MKSILMDNRKFINELIDSTKPVIDFDMYVMDEFLFRVAGTGIYEATIGIALDPGCANDYVLKNKAPLLINNPLEHDVCQQCSMRQICFKEYMIINPIFHNGQICGTIGLGAFGDEKKQRMWTMRKKLVKYLDNLGELIAAKISENIYINRLKAVLDSIHESVFLFDSHGRIIFSNFASEMLLTELGTNNAKTISTLIPEKYIDIISYKDSERQEIEINIQGLYTDKRMYASLIPVNVDEPQNEKILVLRDKALISDLAYRIVSDMSHLPVDIEHIKGNSPEILRAKKMAIKAAKHNSTVLITGESGTGKELFARAIHQLGDRKNKPYIAINCSAIPDSLIESELFGYEDGAFTGAKKGGKPGKFELANGGTLFLDEIGDLNLYLQPKLLRALQSGEIERVGGVKSIKLDIRVIAATNQNLEARIKTGEFREDLYYRLNVIPIEIPALSDRLEDILMLAYHFLHIKSEQLNKPAFSISGDAKRALQLYHWPGNVRELENAIEYAINMKTEGEIKLDNLPSRIRNYESSGRDHQGMSLRQIENDVIRETLIKYGTSIEGKREAAKALNISLSTLYRRISKMS